MNIFIQGVPLDTFLQAWSPAELDEIGRRVEAELERRRQPYGPDNFMVGTVVVFLDGSYKYSAVKADSLVWYTTAEADWPGCLQKRVTWDELTAWCDGRGVKALHQVEHTMPRWRRGTA